MANQQVSIKQLPRIEEINSGDLILVQSANSTNTLDFKDFVIGLENTTFQNTISSNNSNIKSLSSNTVHLSSNDFAFTPNFVTASRTAPAPNADAFLALSGIQMLKIQLEGQSFGVLLSAIDMS